MSSSSAFLKSVNTAESISSPNSNTRIFPLGAQETNTLYTIPEDPVQDLQFLVSPKKPLSEISNNLSITPNLGGQKNVKFMNHSNTVTSLAYRSTISSPKISMENFKLTSDPAAKQFELPAAGSRVMALYRSFLTAIEVVEIRKYEVVYYFGHKAKKLPDNHTDRNGVYRALANDHLGYRYEILEMIGKGTFGHVYKCFDHKHSQLVAIKIIRRNSNIRKQGENEVKILESLNEQDADFHNIVKMLQCFEFRNHLCISYELLSINLYEFLRKNQFSGVNLNLIKRIASQILRALKYVHGFGVFHCDLKLENILLKSESKTSIKIIDFGSATTQCNPLFTYLQSRYYRAPEVILGCGYDAKVDIWSLGCILVELYTGKVLFPGENEKDQLFRIIQVIGEPPLTILEKSLRKNVFFKDNESGVRRRWTLREVISPSDKEETLFEDFVSKALAWDANERFSAEDALKHAWIRGGSRDPQPASKGRLLFTS